MNVFLELTSKTSGPRRVRLKSMTVIGRSKQCQLRISSTEVSREHCQIAVTYDGAFLVDLGSSNGTEVDGQPIKPGAPVKLISGMKLSIGPAHFIVHCVDDASATAGDSSPFLMGRDDPTSDTALIGHGPIPTKLHAPADESNGSEHLSADAGDEDDGKKNEEQPWPRALDAMTEVTNTINDDDEADADFPEWNMNVVDERNSDVAASIHEPANGDSTSKPKKPFSLFSLLKRGLSSEPKSQEADVAPGDSGRHPRVDEDMNEAVPVSQTRSASTKNEQRRRKGSDDDLDEFLKQLS